MGLLSKAVAALPYAWRKHARAALMPTYEYRLALHGDVLQEVEWTGRYNFYKAAFRLLQFNKIPGDYAEFGCHGCATFAIAYHTCAHFRYERHFWAFDSFAGLPPQQGTEDEHPMWRSGSMSTGLDAFHRLCEHRGIPENAYTTVPGFYSESLKKPEMANYPQQIALAYVDCDLYSSTLDVLQFLAPRLQNGSIIAFDDYYCISPTQLAGERRAFNEIFSDHPDWRAVPFIPYAPAGMSFMVESKKYPVPSCGQY
jgi:hypothetical protein